ncbi:hypothetical protein, partial [Leadbetterella sp. DM7]|uniref:beta strand repeat-containing protein n=1 Tax=Leadbetterella sp. DM7 TaxID=3235085 RepID=UPI00349E7BD9
MYANAQTCSGCESGNLVTSGSQLQVASDINAWTAEPVNYSGGSYSGQAAWRHSTQSPVNDNGSIKYGVLNYRDHNADYYVKQEIPIESVVQGRPYTFTVQMTSHATGGTAEMYIQFLNSSGGVISTSSKVSTNNNYPNFQTYTIGGSGQTIPSGTTKIRIVGHSKGNALKFKVVNLIVCYNTINLALTPTNTSCTGSTGTVKATVTGGSGEFQFRIKKGSGSFGSWVTAASPYTFTGLSNDGYTVEVEDKNTSSSSCKASKTATVGKDECYTYSCSNCGSQNLIGNETFANLNGWTATKVNSSGNRVATSGTDEWGLFSGWTWGSYGILNNGDAPSSSSGSPKQFRAEYAIDNNGSGGFKGIIPGRPFQYTANAATHSTSDSWRVAQLYLEFYNGNTLLATSKKATITAIFSNSEAVTINQLEDGGTTIPANTNKIVLVAYAHGRALKFDNNKLVICYPNVGLSLAKQEPDCQNQNGKITVTASGGSGYYEYSKDNTNWQSSSEFTGLTAGNYTLYVRDKFYSSDANCKKSASITLTKEATPTVTVANNGQITCTTGSVITATATPSSGITYTWTVPSGATNPGSVASFTATVAGTYKVKVKSAAGCESSEASTTVTENKTKPTVTVTGGELTCATTSVTVQATASPSTGVTYTWTVPSGVTNPGNVASFSATVAGTYSVKVKNNTTGCESDSKSATVTSSTTKPTVTVTGGELTCATTSVTVQATASPGTGVTYTWTVPSGVTNPGNVASFSATVAGTYSVKVKNNTTGCESDSKSATVTSSTTKPTVTVTGGELTCATTSVTVQATASPSTGVTYTWTVPSGVTNPGNVASFSASVAGTYSVKVKNNTTGCESDSKSATVTSSTTKPTVTVTGGELTCATTSVTVQATASPGTGVTYTWTVPSGVTNPGNVASFSATVAGTYSVKVKNNTTGCESDSKSATVTSNTSIPTVTVNNGQLTCTTTTVKLTANGSPAGVTYSWTGPGGFTATTKEINVTVAGSYEVTVTAPNGCKEKATATVTSDVQKPTVTVNNGQLTCATTSVTVQATASPSTGVTYTWTVPSGVTNPGNVASFSASVAGTYSVKVKNNTTGCESDSKSATVTSSTTKPTVTVTGGELTCATTSVTVQATASPGTGVTYTWTVPSGVTNPGNVASFSATVAGTYSVKVKNNTTGCESDSKSATVTSNTSIPTVTVNNGQLTCTTTTVKLTANGSPAGVTYSWTGPGGFTATTKEINVTVAGS